MGQPKMTRRSFMKMVGVGSVALSLSDQLLVPRASAQSTEAEKETVGYTFCDACNEVPFCGIKFYKKGDVVSRIESWPGSRRPRSAQKPMQPCSDFIIPKDLNTR